MAQKELVFKVKVVNESGDIVEQTAKSFEDLNKSASSLKKELEKSDLGSEKFNKLQKELKNTEGAIESAKNKTTPLLQRFSEMPGLLGTVSQSLQGLGQGFKALIANPVGAVIAAIAVVFGVLYKALTRTDEGMDKVNRIMAKFGAILDPVMEAIGAAALLIADFVETALDGFTSLIQLIPGMGEEMKAAAEEGGRLADELDSIQEAERDLAVARSEQNKQLAKARELLSDSNASLAERKAALAEVRAGEEKLAKLEENTARRKLQAIKDEIKLKGASEERLNAQAQAEIALNQAQENTAAVTRKLNKQDEQLDREAEQRQKEAAEKRKQRTEERKKQAEEAASFEKALDLAVITDKFQRDQQILANEKAAQQKQLSQLKVTAEKRVELQLQIEEVYQNKLKELQDAKKAEEEKKADEEKKKEQEKTAEKIDQRKRELEALLQLSSEKGIEGLEDTKRYLDELMAIELSAANISEAEKQVIRDKYNKAEIDAEKKVFDEKKALNRKVLDEEIKMVQAAAQGAADLAVIFGAETEAGKAAATAAAILNTYAGAAKALNDETIPNTFLRIVAAGAVIATGLKQVATINKVSTQIPTPNISRKLASGGYVSGNGSDTSDSITASLSNGEFVMNSQSTSLFRPLLETMNQQGRQFSTASTGVQGISTIDAAMMGSLGSIGQTPIKTYVVASEVTTVQQIERQNMSRSVM